MTDTERQPTGSPAVLEREKWEAERAFREREVAVREREQAAKEAELALAKADRAAARWRSPLIVAILAAAVAALGNAAVAYTTGASQTRLEAQKAEQARILEMLHTGGPDSAAQNLQFLLRAGLIGDPGIRRDLTRFLATRTPGSGPALPSTSGASAGLAMVSKFEPPVLKAYADVVAPEHRLRACPHAGRAQLGETRHRRTPSGLPLGHHPGAGDPAAGQRSRAVPPTGQTAGRGEAHSRTAGSAR